jgi:hypothetical protein
MKTIKVLRNFGVGATHYDAGQTITIDPDAFGGTYDDHLSAGLFEEVEPEAEGDTKTATLSGPTNDKGTPADDKSTPTQKGGRKAQVVEPDGTTIDVPAGSSLTELP